MKKQSKNQKIRRFKYGSCECGKAGTKPHLCPYKSELRDTEKERNELCNCCKECEKQCHDDV